MIILVIIIYILKNYKLIIICIYFVIVYIYIQIYLIYCIYLYVMHINFYAHNKRFPFIIMIS